MRICELFNLSRRESYANAGEVLGDARRENLGGGSCDSGNNIFTAAY